VALAIPAAASAQVVNGCRIEPRTSCPGVNLHGADLRGAALLGADLRGADLSTADLTRAELTGANLHGANLIRTNLTEATVAGADLGDASLTSANLTRADLRIASIPNAKLPSADLRGANVEGANLNGDDLSDANFDGAKLRHAQLIRVTARSTRFAGVLMEHADMSSGDFWHANFDGSQLDYANLIGAILDGVRAHSTNFAGAQMERAVAYAGDFVGSNFHSTRLADAVFALANVQNASFVYAGFNHTDFQGAHVGGAILFPSNIASDRTARWYFFAPVLTHVNAYGDYGHCDGSGSGPNNAVSCSGRNDATNATFGLGQGVSFRWGTQQTNGLRGFKVTGSDGVELFGESDLGLSVFHAHAIGLGNLAPTAEHSPAGEAGGPLYLYVGYTAHFPTPGYVLSVIGWLRREGTAPTGAPLR
jgi:uncharacterized protein YjbI with pentapeptide repeats